MRKLQLCRAPKIASLVPKSFNGVAAGLSFLVRELYESGSMLLHSQISRTFIQPYVNPRLPDCDTQVFSANHIPFFILHFRVVKTISRYYIAEAVFVMRSIIFLGWLSLPSLSASSLLLLFSCMVSCCYRHKFSFAIHQFILFNDVR